MVAQNLVTPGRGGCIVTMSRCEQHLCSKGRRESLADCSRSVNAEMAIPTIAGYNASKGGVSNLTRCMVRGMLGDVSSHVWLTELLF